MTKRAAVRKPPRHAADAIMAVFGPVKPRRKRKAMDDDDEEEDGDDASGKTGTHLYLSDL